MIYRHRHRMASHIVMIMSHVPTGTAHVRPHVVMVMHAVLGVIHMVHVIHFPETRNQRSIENHLGGEYILTYAYKLRLRKEIVSTARGRYVLICV